MALFFPRETFFADFDRMMNAHLNALTNADSSANGAPQTSKDLASRHWGGSFAARLDLTETNEGYVVHADLPGVDKNEVDISIKDDVLTISGERKTFNETKDENRHIVERSFGKFSRSVRLPENADKNNVEAKMDNGVLEVVLTKTQANNNVKKINIA